MFRQSLSDWSRKPEPIGNGRYPRLSPDSRLLLFRSDETESWVLAGADGKVQGEIGDGYWAEFTSHGDEVAVLRNTSGSVEFVSVESMNVVRRIPFSGHVAALAASNGLVYAIEQKYDKGVVVIHTWAKSGDAGKVYTFEGFRPVE